MATCSTILAWESPQTEKPGYSPWGCKESHTTECTHRDIDNSNDFLITNMP